MSERQIKSGVQKWPTWCAWYNDGDPGLHVHMASSKPRLVHVLLLSCRLNLLRLRRNKEIFKTWNHGKVHRNVSLRSRVYDCYAELKNEKSRKTNKLN